jgi:hypothetical protein
MEESSPVTSFLEKDEESVARSDQNFVRRAGQWLARMVGHYSGDKTYYTHLRRSDMPSHILLPLPPTLNTYRRVGQNIG